MRLIARYYHYFEPTLLKQEPWLSVLLLSFQSLSCSVWVHISANHAKLFKTICDSPTNISGAEYDISYTLIWLITHCASSIFLYTESSIQGVNRLSRIYSL